jgi:hypothetical protein
MGVKGFINKRHRICLQRRYPEVVHTGPLLFYRVSSS